MRVPRGALGPGLPRGGLQFASRCGRRPERRSASPCFGRSRHGARALRVHGRESRPPAPRRRPRRSHRTQRAPARGGRRGLRSARTGSRAAARGWSPRSTACRTAPGAMSSSASCRAAKNRARVTSSAASPAALKAMTIAGCVFLFSSPLAGKPKLCAFRTATGGSSFLSMPAPLPGLNGGCEFEVWPHSRNPRLGGHTGAAGRGAGHPGKSARAVREVPDEARHCGHDAGPTEPWTSPSPWTLPAGSRVAPWREPHSGRPGLIDADHPAVDAGHEARHDLLRRTAQLRARDLPAALINAIVVWDAWTSSPTQRVASATVSTSQLCVGPRRRYRLREAFARAAGTSHHPGPHWLRGVLATPLREPDRPQRAGSPAIRSSRASRGARARARTHARRALRGEHGAADRRALAREPARS